MLLIQPLKSNAAYEESARRYYERRPRCIRRPEYGYWPHFGAVRSMSAKPLSPGEESFSRYHATNVKGTMKKFFSCFKLCSRKKD